MSKWIESRGGDLILRAMGSMLVVSAWYEARLLRQLMHLRGPSQATLGELGLAALLFLSTSFGLALLIVGHHLWDPIAVSDRWAKRFPRQTRDDAASFQLLSEDDEPTEYPAPFRRHRSRP